MSDRAAEAAYSQGVQAARVIGLESQSVYNPYDDVTESPLYAEWDRGYDDASQPGFVHRDVTTDAKADWRRLDF